MKVVKPQAFVSGLKIHRASELVERDRDLYVEVIATAQSPNLYKISGYLRSVQCEQNKAGK